MKQEIPPKSENKETEHIYRVKARIEEVKKRQAEIAELIKSSKSNTIVKENEELTKEAFSLEEELNKIKVEDHEQTQKRAHEIYEDRIKKGKGGNEKTDWEQVEKEKEEKNIKKDIEAKHDKKDEEENKKIIEKQLAQAGLKEDDFKNIPEWNNLSDGQRMLVIEQAAQDTLSHVKEIGEQRFQEKNKLSLNPKTWVKNLTKSVWISKEEKSAIEDVKNGKIKPNEEKLRQLTERTVDMKLNAVIKDGKASIEFMPMDKSLSKEQQEVVENYNKIANEFSKLPDSWKNERSAASQKSDLFNKNKSEYFDKYKNIELEYKKAKDALLEIKTEQYGEKKAMDEMKDKDFEIAMLQFTNTNPDAIEELNKIEKESSWGRLVSNENIWRGLYMGSGFVARKGLTYGLGLLAAPIVAGTIGGIRAREKAKQKINTAFMEGRKEETSRERKENGTVGKINDKNAETGIISKVFSGQKVNTKEVAAFVEADSQILRLKNWMNRLDKATSDKEKLILSDELSTRIDFIEQKHREGLINYGTKNAVGTNYELFKILGDASVKLGDVKFLIGVEDAGMIIEENNKRKDLLEKIMADNEARLGHKQAVIKNQEMLRGMAVSAGFATLGFYIREFMHGAPSVDTHANVINTHVEGGHLIKDIDIAQVKPFDESEMKTFLPHTNTLNPDAIVHKSEGIENTFIRQIQNNHELAKSLGFKGDVNDTKALHAFAGREAHILAMKEGYVGTNGQEIRIKEIGADKVAYEIKMENGHAVVNEKTVEGKIIETHHEGDKFGTKSNEYESVHNAKNANVEHSHAKQPEVKTGIKKAIEQPEKIKSVLFVQQKQLDTVELSKKAEEAITKEQIISRFNNISEQTKNTYAEDLMKVTDEPIEQNEVGRELIHLRDTIQTRTGALINPKESEDLNSYVNRLLDRDISVPKAPAENIVNDSVDINKEVPQPLHKQNIDTLNNKTIAPKLPNSKESIWLSGKNKDLNEFIKKDNPFKGESITSDDAHYRQVGFGENSDLEKAKILASDDAGAKIIMESGSLKLNSSNISKIKEVIVHDDKTGLYRVYHVAEVDKHLSSSSAVGTEHATEIDSSSVNKTSVPIENAKVNINEEQLANFHKAFPGDEIIHGIPRSEYDNKVANYLSSIGKVWKNQADRNADLWLWEKFGKIDPITSPSENSYWHLAETRSDTSAMDLMEAEKNDSRYVVGKELLELLKLVKAKTGEEINPEMYESPTDYVRRLMKSIEG